MPDEHNRSAPASATLDDAASVDPDTLTTDLEGCDVTKAIVDTTRSGVRFFHWRGVLLERPALGSIVQWSGLEFQVIASQTVGSMFDIIGIEHG